jgi:hypothetical protein
MIIFRNLPMQWWLIAIGIYALRVGFSLNFGPALVGFYVDHVGWQWLYWQDALLAVLMAILVYLGAPREPVNKALLETADWGGMLLLGSGIAMIYAGLDQGNRLDWLGSGTVVALLASGAMLIVAFFINEAMVKDPWAHANVLLSRNIGFALVVILLYTLTSLSNSSLVPGFLSTVAQLRPEQTGRLLLVYCVLPMAITFPLSIWMARRFDVRILLLIGLLARGGGPAWNPDYPRMGAERLHPDGAAAIRRAVLHTSANHPDCAGQLRSDPGDRLRRLYPDHAPWRSRDRNRAHGDLAAGPRTGAFQPDRPARHAREGSGPGPAHETVGVFFQPWRGDRAGTQHGETCRHRAAGSQCAGLYRRVLADLRLCGRGPACHRIDHPSAAGTLHPQSKTAIK